MSLAQALLDELSRRGVELWADRGMVRGRTAPGSMIIRWGTGAIVATPLARRHGSTARHS